MFRIIQSGFLVSFFLAFIILSQVKPDILSQSKAKNINWPEPKFEHITVKDGLPNNSIMFMMQDHLGYLWFGSVTGITRYDGYSTKTFALEEGIYNRSTTVNKIYEDHSGTLWAGTMTGLLYKFNRGSETFERFLDKNDKTVEENQKVDNILYQDKKGNIWCSVENTLSLLDSKKHKFKIYPFSDSVYTRETYEYLLSLKTSGHLVGEITKVGNNANLTKTFILKQKTKVIVTIMGEKVVDFGWIENEKGEKVISPDVNNSVFAGGGNSNFQIIQSTLNAGSYKIRYVSDYGQSYGNWNVPPPDFPDFWGIQVLSSDSEKDIITKKYTTVPFEMTSIIGDSSNGLLYILGRRGLYTFDENNGKFTKQSLQFKTGSFFDLNGSVLKSSDGKYWIGSEKGLACFNSGTREVKLYQVIKSEQYIEENDFNVDGRGRVAELGGFIWVGSKNGNLVCFDPVTETFHIFKNDPNDPTGLGHSNAYGVYSIMVDKSGMMWIVLAGNGLDKCNINKTKFSSYKYNLDKQHGLGSNEVLCMMEEYSGQIWIGTSGGGLVKYNTESKSFKAYKYDPKNRNSISDNSVRSICADPVDSSVLWIGTVNGGLDKFETKSGAFKYYLNDPADSTSISSNDIQSILPEGKDFLWVGTSNEGVNLFSKKTGKFKRFRNEPGDTSNITIYGVWSCLKDKSGAVWIGTVNSFGANGLSRYNYDSHKFKSFSATEVGSVPDYVLSIYENKAGNFWIGDAISGLYLFDRKKEGFVSHFTQTDGLPNNTITSILEDGKGNLWLGTYNGLSKFNPVTKTFRNYYEEDGLNGNKFNGCFKSKTGELYFFGENGFSWFNPDKVIDDPVPPQVVISGLSLFNHPGEKLNIDGFLPDMKEVKLAYNQNDLRFDYVGIHYGNPSKNRYKYKLEGFDKDWVDAGTQRNAIYTNLSAGEYVFKVTASNSDGVWNEKGASLRLIIPPPFWATWWAYLLYVLVGIYILNVLRKYELNRVNLKNQVKLDEVKLREREETDRMKSRFFANISHEFRTPLTLILGPSESIVTTSKEEETKKKAGIIKRNASRLLDLINQLLDLSKLEAGKMKLKASKGNIAAFAKGITMSFESIAERKDISLKLKSDRDEIEAYFDRDMMSKILSNLLSNAFKFTGEGGSITVTVEVKSDESVRIAVKDTGIGISEEEVPKLFDRFYQVDSSQTREYEGSGLGLALTKELVELHGGKIIVKSRSGEGSEFTVELPPGRRHLKDNEIIEQGEIATAEIPEEKLSENIYIADRKEETDEKDIDKTIILVVEDNSDVREYIKDSLGNDYKVEEAINGEQGLRKAEQIIPDLIISDIMMPKMDGNELTRRIKNDEKTSHIPVILLTAKSEQESRLEGLETGADDYLIKPFDTKELRIRIKNLINIRRKLQEKYSRGYKIALKSTDGEKKLSSLEEQFMNKIGDVVEKHFSEEEFSIEQFGEEVGMSRVQLHRKLKALTGKSASLYLRSVRLMKARKWIEEGKGNISEIAYASGFSSPQYFTHCFKEEFGFPPGSLMH